jgi:hypothetical protein
MPYTDDILKEHDEVTKELGKVLKEHDEVTKELGKVLKEDGEVLKEDVKVLKEYDEVLKEDGEVAKEHVKVLKEDGKIAKEYCKVLKEDDEVAKEYCKVLKEHDKIAKEYCKVLKEHGKVAKEYCKVTKEHGEVTKEHGEITKEHGKVTNELGEVVKELGGIMKDECVLLPQNRPMIFGGGREGGASGLAQHLPLLASPNATESASNLGRDKYVLLSQNRSMILGEVVHNRLNHAFNIIHHLIVPKANDFVALRFQIFCSLVVVFLLFQMLTPIQFDNQFCFGGAKIGDVLSDGVLSSKVDAQLVVADVRPKFSLGGRGFFPKFDGAVHGVGVAS